MKLTAAEDAELELKRARRNLDVSNYFRTLMEEDDHGAER